MVRKIILASNSPRRRQLLEGLDIPFEVRVMPNIDEGYPDDTDVDNIAEYIAREKSSAYDNIVGDGEVVITADTIVVVDNVVLGKPHSREDAVDMLKTLSGCTHKVITGVCLLSKKERRSFSVTTKVTFKQLSDDEIAYYVDTYKPFDKAGAYGIQEWIGYIGVTRLEGSYFNVMGLPVQRIWDELARLNISCV